jgi:hypothetical protein
VSWCPLLAGAITHDTLNNLFCETPLSQEEEHGPARMLPAPTLEAQCPARQRFFIQAVKALDNGIIRQRFTEPFCHQFTLESVTAHRTARQRCLNPSGGVGPIVKIP